MLARSATSFATSSRSTRWGHAAADLRRKMAANDRSTRRR